MGALVPLPVALILVTSPTGEMASPVDDELLHLARAGRSAFATAAAKAASAGSSATGAGQLAMMLHVMLCPEETQVSAQTALAHMTIEGLTTTQFPVFMCHAQLQIAISG